MSEVLLDDSTLLSRLLRRQLLDHELQLSLVRSLFRPVRQIAFSIVLSFVVMMYAIQASGDATYLVLGTLMFVVGLMRLASMVAFDLMSGHEADLRRLDAWENVALVGALVFASLVGTAAGYASWSRLDPEAEVLVVASGLSYVAGIAGRNVARREIVIGQAVCACVPMFIGLVSRGDASHYIMASIVALSGILALSLATRLAKTLIEGNRAEKDRCEMEGKLRLQAEFDSLTGLRNRNGFMARLGSMLAEGGAADRRALVLIDLDGFKQVNDRLGHHMGDRVLCEVGRRITESVRPGDVAARISGDEFHVMLRDVDAATADEIARRIHAELSRPHAMGTVVVAGAASMGVAMVEEGDDAEAVMLRVDLALYASKAEGRGRVTMFTDGIRADYVRRKQLEEDLPAAIATDRVFLNYQPIVDPRTNRVRSCEALVRWDHPTLGPVNPMEFVGVAERTGCIDDLGRKVLRQACFDALSFPEGVSVAVNVSPAQFHKGVGVVGDVAMALAESGLSATRLEVEITESVFLGDKPRVQAVLSGIASLGVRVALDDFGEGQTSLGHLQDYEFHKLKLDKKFTDALPGNARTLAIVRGIVGMAADIGLDVVMEGVEHPSQRDCVAALGINLIQGYLYSRPLPLPQALAKVESLGASPARGAYARGSGCAA